MARQTIPGPEAKMGKNGNSPLVPLPLKFCICTWPSNFVFVASREVTQLHAGDIQF